MSDPLHNYLKTHRKHAGLSQAEVAFLLDHPNAQSVSRYERQTQKPDLEDAFAFQVMFAVPAHDVFEGIFREVEITTQNRAYLLSKKLELEPPTPKNKPKLNLVRTIYMRALE